MRYCEESTGGFEGKKADGADEIMRRGRKVFMGQGSLKYLEAVVRTGG